MTENIKVYTRTYFACPACGQDEFSCDHLPDGTLWGPWSCRKCGIVFRGSAKAGAPIDVEIDKDQRARNTLALLRLREDLASGTPVFLIVKGRHVASDKPIGETDAYFYDEHTCPTNYLSQAEMIIEGDDTDPHGIFEWIATIEQPEGLDHLESYEDVSRLFPALLTQGGILIDGEVAAAPRAVPRT